MSLEADWRVWSNSGGGWECSDLLGQHAATVAAGAMSTTAARHGRQGLWLALPDGQTPADLPAPDCAGSTLSGEPCQLPIAHEGDHSARSSG